MKLTDNISKNSDLDEDFRSRQETEIRLLRELLNRVSAHAEGLEKELNALRQEVDGLRRSSGHWEHEATQLRLVLDAVYASSSWRITLPARKLSSLIRWFCRLPLRFFRRRIPLEEGAPAGRGQIPGDLSGRKSFPRQPGRGSGQPELTELSPREFEIYHELRQVIDKKKNGN